MIKTITPHIRTATIQDAEGIARIHIRSWQKMYRDFIPETILANLSLEERTEEWSGLIKEGVKVLVIEMNHRIVGFASICAFNEGSEEDSMGEISAIYVHPNHWRKGLGSQLCLAALSELKQQGYAKVLLWIFEANEQARTFYEAFGFTATHFTKLAEFYEGGALLKEILYEKIM